MKTERELILNWLEAERVAHQDRKFEDLRPVHDTEMLNSGIDQSGYWWQQINMYFYRANVLGIDTLLGKQAAAKGVATALGMLESVVRVYGELPAPGVPSGEVQSWTHE